MKDDEWWSDRISVADKKNYVDGINFEIGEINDLANRLDDYLGRKSDGSPRDSGSDSDPGSDQDEDIDEQKQRDDFAKFSAELDEETKRKIVEIGKSADSSYQEAMKENSHNSIKAAIDHNRTLVEELNGFLAKGLYTSSKVRIKETETQARIDTLTQMRNHLIEEEKRELVASAKSAEAAYKEAINLAKENDTSAPNVVEVAISHNQQVLDKINTFPIDGYPLRTNGKLKADAAKLKTEATKRIDELKLLKSELITRASANTQAKPGVDTDDDYSYILY